MTLSVKIQNAVKAALFTGLLCCLFTSCGTKYTKEITQLDSLQLDLTAIEKKLTAIDTTQLQRINAEMAEKIGFIQVNSADTIDLTLAQTLDSYNTLRLELIAILEQYHELTGSIKSEGKQINDLKHDLKYNLPDQIKVKEYCMAEKNTVDTIQVSAAIIIEAKEEKIRKLKELAGLVDAEVARIKECIREENEK